MNTRQIVTLETVDSTNLYLKRLLTEGYPVGTAVTAKEQTAGRGQLGRRWYSPKGSSVSLSVSVECSDARILPFAAGVAGATAISSVTGVNCKVRWPNDLMAGGRKLGGILIESGGAGAIFIIGIGINANVPSFPPELEEIATSCLIESGKRCDISLLQDALLFETDSVLSRCKRLPEILAEWRKYDSTPGSRIRTTDGETEKQVTAAFVDDEGCLVTAEGSRIVSSSLFDCLYHQDKRQGI